MLLMLSGSASGLFPVFFSPAPTDKWQHVAVVYTPDSIRFFLDGEEYFCPDKPVGQESSTRLRIGGSPFWRQFFDGLVDDVRIYDRALTEKEIHETFERLHPAARIDNDRNIVEAPPPPAQQEASEKAGESDIDSLVKRAMKTARLKSLGVAIIRRDHPATISVQGKRGGTDLREDAPFVIASTRGLQIPSLAKGLSW